MAKKQLASLRQRDEAEQTAQSVETNGKAGVSDSNIAPAHAKPQVASVDAELAPVHVDTRKKSAEEPQSIAPNTGIVPAPAGSHGTATNYDASSMQAKSPTTSAGAALVPAHTKSQRNTLDGPQSEATRGGIVPDAAKSPAHVTSQWRATDEPPSIMTDPVIFPAQPGPRGTATDRDTPPIQAKPQDASAGAEILPVQAETPRTAADGPRGIVAGTRTVPVQAEPHGTATDVETAVEKRTAHSSEERLSNASLKRISITKLDAADVQVLLQQGIAILSRTAAPNPETVSSAVVEDLWKAFDALVYNDVCGEALEPLIEEQNGVLMQSFFSLDLYCEISHDSAKHLCRFLNAVRL